MLNYTRYFKIIWCWWNKKKPIFSPEQKPSSEKFPSFCRFFRLLLSKPQAQFLTALEAMTVIHAKRIYVFDVTLGWIMSHLQCDTNRELANKNAVSKRIVSVMPLDNRSPNNHSLFELMGSSRGSIKIIMNWTEVNDAKDKDSFLTRGYQYQRIDAILFTFS